MSEETLETSATEAAAEEPKASKPAKEPMTVGRRNAMIGIGGTVALLALGSTRKLLGHTALIHPPGGQDETNLVTKCIRCEKCYEVCPRKVITPAHVEYGLLGMRAPTMYYQESYCDFCLEENGGTPRCASVCPTGALELAEGADYTNTFIGKALIDTYQCLAYRTTACRTCYDNCPFGAIVLDETIQSLPLPLVVLDKCNGCGACQSVCLSLTAGSIVSGSTQRAIYIQTEDSAYEDAEDNRAVIYSEDMDQYSAPMYSSVDEWVNAADSEGGE